MAPRPPPPFVRSLGVAGLVLAVVTGMLAHAALSDAAGPVAALALPVVVLVAVGLVVAAAVRVRGDAARRQAELLAEVRAANEKLTAQAADLARQRDESRLLESAVVHARVAVVVLDADPHPDAGHPVRYVNDAFTRMSGYARDEVLGRPLPLLRDTDADPPALARFREAFAAGRPLQTDLRGRRKDGTEYWVELGLVPVPRSDGRVAHWVMIQRDVTDRKRAEDALRASEERLRVVGDNLPAGTVYQLAVRPDGTGGFVYISAGVERVFGYTPAEVTADAGLLHRLVHPDDLPGVRAAELDARRGMVTFDQEFRTHTRSGAVKWLHARSMPAPLPDGGSLWNGVILDVTARKEAEEALRRSEGMFRGIFEGAAAGVSLTDAAGRFIACNPAFAAMLGRPVAEVLGLTPADVTHPDDWAAQVPAYEAARAGERDRFEIGKRYVRPDGGVVWAEMSFAAIRGPDGGFEYGLGVSVDVTARRRLEEQLRQARTLESVGHLAGGVAHDFNNLLTAVLGNLALVRLPAGDPGREHLAAVERATTRAAELTAKLLGYARRNQLAPGPVSPGDAFHEAVVVVRQTLDPRVRVAVHVAPDCPPVFSDPGLLHQMLVNLCTNARDAMPAGGTLTLDAAPAGADHPPHPDYAALGFVRLSVTDTGVGMTDEVQARIFEPFFSTKDVGRGTGLGLSMVRGVVEQHHGSVACTSASGAGTRIDLFLPAAIGRPGDAPAARSSAAQSPHSLPRPAPQTPPDTASAAGPVVLLVDDEAMIRDLGRLVLEHAGYTVLTANDGVEAVEVFARERGAIGLVVLDVTMPRMSGVDAFHQIVGLDPAARVLFSTGYSSDDVAAVDGAVGLLSKPYRPPDLLAAVRAALAGRRVGGPDSPESGD